jgi:hypothetical protein
MSGEEIMRAVYGIEHGIRSSQDLREKITCDNGSILKVDANRHYLTKKDRVKYRAFLDIFPWFNVPFERQDQRFRESNFAVNDQNAFIDALLYFCDVNFHDPVKTLQFIQICSRLAEGAEEPGVITGMENIARRRPFSMVIQAYRKMVAEDADAIAEIDPYVFDNDGDDTGVSLDTDSCDLFFTGSESQQIDNSSQEWFGSSPTFSQSPVTDSEASSVDRTRSASSVEERVDNLEDRVDTLEGGRVRLPTGKYSREGGDRARWVRIIPSLVGSKDQWCKPGAVMGVFPNGVGPLDSKAHIHKIRGIVVYSTNPDVIEPLPQEVSPELYVPIVLVSRYAPSGQCMIMMMCGCV